MADDQSFLSRADLAHLAEKLDLVGDLELELALAATSQANPDAGGIRRPQPGPRAPHNLNIQALIDELNNTLSTTIRDVCEHRAMRHDGGSSCAAMAKWLHRYRAAIGMMEHGPELADELCSIITRCDEMLHRPDSESLIERELSASLVTEANRQVVTAPQVEGFARRTGLLADGLNESRVTYLRKRHGLRGHQDPDTRTWFYRLGDVIAAHQAAAKRPGP